MDAPWKNTFRLLAACGLVSVGLLCEGASAAGSVWSFHEKNYEIYSPALSKDNTRLTFVRKRHIPDGHEAELFSEEELRRIMNPLETNERFADPEVMAMDVSGKDARFLDYGWDPAFSSDQAKIYYARQKNPVSRYRVLASTLAGNEICEYDLKRHESALLAQPTSGYFSLPLPTESGTVAFALSDAVNGSWGGNIGVDEFDPGTGKHTALYAPVKERGLYHLVNKFAMEDGTCLVLRLRPMTEGAYLADSYAYELVDAKSGTVLHSWGERELSGNVPADFRICPSGPEIYDGGWKARPWDEPARTPDPGPGISSPDCGSVAAFDKHTVTIRSSRGEPARTWTTPEGSIQSVTWSPDSSRIVLVVSHGADFGEKFAFDALVIVPVDAMTAAR